MEFGQLNNLVNLKTRGGIDKIAHCSNFSMRYHDTETMDDILRQIGVNLSWLIERFDRMPIEDIVLELRKNCIKTFEKGFYGNNKCTASSIRHMEIKKRPEAKAKLYFIHNQIWTYLLSRKGALSSNR